ICMDTRAQLCASMQYSVISLEVYRFLMIKFKWYMNSLRFAYSGNICMQLIFG
ncbi:hypothetical protein ACJX0J_030633, partial [Zea mays]